MDGGLGLQRDERACQWSSLPGHTFCEEDGQALEIVTAAASGCGPEASGCGPEAGTEQVWRWDLFLTSARWAEAALEKRHGPG